MPDASGAWLAVVDVAYVEGAGERYLLPTRVGEDGLVEAGPEDDLWPALVRWIASGGSSGHFVGSPGPPTTDPSAPGRALTDDQSNTSIVLGERLVLKCYRQLLPGVHPEPELLAGLGRVGSRRAPRFGGSLGWRSPDAGETTLACLYEFVQGEPVGWEPLVRATRDALQAEDRIALHALALELAGLGSATAELHLDLAGAFGVGVATDEDASVAVAVGRAQLDEALAAATGELQESLGAHAGAAAAALDYLWLLAGAPVTRCHGDLHVAQFVRTSRGPVAVDFEGEPGRSLETRRGRGSPLLDVASLLLSFDHVAAAAARRLDFGPALDAAFAWSAEARSLATESYRAGIAGSELAFDERLLAALEVERECHEVIYAAKVLPEWSYAPRLALERLLGTDRR